VRHGTPRVAGVLRRRTGVPYERYFAPSREVSRALRPRYSRRRVQPRRRTMRRVRDACGCRAGAAKDVYAMMRVMTEMHTSVLRHGPLYMRICYAIDLCDAIIVADASLLFVDALFERNILRDDDACRFEPFRYCYRGEVCWRFFSFAFSFFAACLILPPPPFSHIHDVCLSIKNDQSESAQAPMPKMPMTPRLASKCRKKNAEKEKDVDKRKKDKRLVHARVAPAAQERRRDAPQRVISASPVQQDDMTYAAFAPRAIEMHASNAPICHCLRPLPPR